MAMLTEAEFQAIPKAPCPSCARDVTTAYDFQLDFMSRPTRWCAN